MFTADSRRWPKKFTATSCSATIASRPAETDSWFWLNRYTRGRKEWRYVLAVTSHLRQWVPKVMRM
jgi:hypothetical protein